MLQNQARAEAAFNAQAAREQAAISEQEANAAAVKIQALQRGRKARLEARLLSEQQVTEGRGAQWRVLEFRSVVTRELCAEFLGSIGPNFRNTLKHLTKRQKQMTTRACKNHSQALQQLT